MMAELNPTKTLSKLCFRKMRNHDLGDDSKASRRGALFVACNHICLHSLDKFLQSPNTIILHNCIPSKSFFLDKLETILERGEIECDPWSCFVSTSNKLSNQRRPRAQPYFLQLWKLCEVITRWKAINKNCKISYRSCCEQLQKMCPCKRQMTSQNQLM